MSATMDDARDLITSAVARHTRAGIKTDHAFALIGEAFGIPARRVKMFFYDEGARVDDGMLATWRAAYRRHLVEWAARLEREAEALEREAARLGDAG